MSRCKSEIWGQRNTENSLRDQLVYPQILNEVMPIRKDVENRLALNWKESSKVLA